MKQLDADSELIAQEVQARLLSEARAQVLYYARQLDLSKSANERLRADNMELRSAAQHWINFSGSTFAKLFFAYVSFNRSWLGMPLRIVRRLVRKKDTRAVAGQTALVHQSGLASAGIQARKPSA